MSDTKVSLNGTQPAGTTRFPGYFLDTRDIYRGFLPLADRSVEELRFSALLLSAEDVTLKVELKDEDDFDVFTRITLPTPGGEWQDIALELPGDFVDSVAGGGNTTAFDWKRVSVLAFIIERVNVGAGVSNPDAGEFLIDGLALADVDGEYPDLALANDPGDSTDPKDDSLLPQYTDAFLDLVRASSFQYFLDFASIDPRAGASGDPPSGGIIQDRSPFADLMTVGGMGFQLTSYVIGAERGYTSREEAAARTHGILEVLRDHPQGFQPVGNIGYMGFFYHFLGIDGLRKQNFDFKATTIEEDKNTVELSIIDTALAVAGVLTASQYFDGDNSVEGDIRSWAGRRDLRECELAVHAGGELSAVLSRMEAERGA